MCWQHCCPAEVGALEQSWPHEKREYTGTKKIDELPHRVILQEDLDGTCQQGCHARRAQRRTEMPCRVRRVLFCLGEFDEPNAWLSLERSIGAVLLNGTQCKCPQLVVKDLLL